MLCHFERRAGYRDVSLGEVKPLSNGKYLAFEQDCQLNCGVENNPEVHSTSKAPLK